MSEPGVLAKLGGDRVFRRWQVFVAVLALAASALYLGRYALDHQLQASHFPAWNLSWIVASYGLYVLTLALIEDAAALEHEDEIHVI